MRIGNAEYYQDEELHHDTLGIFLGNIHVDNLPKSFQFQLREAYRFTILIMILVRLQT